MAEREKSALYPGITWNECVDFLQKIGSFNTRAVSYQELAKKYGLSSPTTKSFTARIGAAKQFGLITTAQGTIQLTDQGNRLLFPTNASTRDIELECFAQPPLYAKLISKYDGLAIPSADILANILMNEHRITKSVKDLAAKCFIESAEQLELIKGGVFCYSDENERIKANSEHLLQKTTDESYLDQPAIKQGAIQVEERVSPVSSESDYISQSIPFESGKIARFIIPVDATEDDLLLLHDMFDVLLRRKFKIEIK